MPENASDTYLGSLKYKATIADFDTALSELESRGLLQWNRHSNTYDLHPVVRGYAFDQIEKDDRIQTYDRIRDHFEALPPEDFNDATDVSHVRNTLQIFRALMGAGRLAQAASLYLGGLNDSLLFSIGSYPTVVELLTPMFTNGSESPPALSSVKDQGLIINSLGVALKELGRHKESQARLQLAIRLNLESENWRDLSVNIVNYATGASISGKLATAINGSELAYNLALAAGAKNVATGILYKLAKLYFDEGRDKDAQTACTAFSARPTPERHQYRIGSVEAILCWLKFRRNKLQATELEEALKMTIRGKNLSGQSTILHLQAEIALRKGILHEAVEAADREIEILRKTGVPDAYGKVFIARILAMQGRLYEAQSLVEEAGLEGNWEAAEVYLQLDDCNKAKEHAMLAYKKAWADGPPHIFWWDLENSKRILARLGIPEPELPPFDPSKVEPIPYEDEIRAAIEELKAEKARRKAAAGSTPPKP